MSRIRRVLLSALSLSLVLVGGCKDSQTPKTDVASAPKPGRWVAQFRSPLSTEVQGINLAFYSYNAISVVSPQIVFVAADIPRPKAHDQRIGVIVRTTDGGQTWTETLIEHPHTRIAALNSIFFLNENLGWAVGLDSGGGGVLIKTTDGGGSWTVTPIPFKQVPMSVFFLDEDTGWMAGSTPPIGEDDGDGGPSDLLMTADGGLTWTSKRRLSTSLSNVHFLDKEFGWIGGFRGMIQHTTDGGLTWNPQRSELEASEGVFDFNPEGLKLFQMTDIQFVDKDHGWAAAAAEEEDLGRVLATTNGGQTWSRRWIVADSGVRGLFFVDTREGYAVTEHGPYAYRTVDGGVSWLAEPVEFEQQVPLYRVAAADSAHVWAVGGGAIFFRQP